jgi:hypothetical protein
MRNIKEDIKSVTRARAIHLHCYECNGIRRFKTESDCVDPGCHLYPLRPGDGPVCLFSPRAYDIAHREILSRW